MPRAPKPKRKPPCPRPHADTIADQQLWEQCKFIGMQDLEDDGWWLELRDCPCGSTIAKRVKLTGNPPPSQLMTLHDMAEIAFDALDEKRPEATQLMEPVLAAVREHGDREGYDDAQSRRSAGELVDAQDVDDALEEYLNAVGHGRPLRQMGLSDRAWEHVGDTWNEAFVSGWMRAASDPLTERERAVAEALGLNVESFVPLVRDFIVAVLDEERRRRGGLTRLAAPGDSYYDRARFTEQVYDAARRIATERFAGRDHRTPVWVWNGVMIMRDPNPEHGTMPLTDNPPWVINLLAKHFEMLEDKVPAKWLPRLSRTRATRTRMTAAMKELGCGAYGCVLPSLDPKVVIKVTTDATEAQFANELADNLSAQVTVKYHLIAGLPETHRGLKTYLLWRDAADDVGDIDKVAEREGRNGEKVEQAIHEQHRAAQVAYLALAHGEPATTLIDAWERSLVEMGKKVPELRELADGLVTVLRKDKILFGDIHGGNLGRVDGRWLIIDPGHVAILQSA